MVPLFLYRKPPASINTAPPLFVEVAFINVEFMISTSSNSFIATAPALFIACRFMNVEL